MSHKAFIITFIDDCVPKFFLYRRVCLRFKDLSSQLGLSNTLTVPLQSGETPSRHECPVYDTKQSDDEVPVILELWEMRITPSLPLLPGPLCSGVVALIGLYQWVK